MYYAQLGLDETSLRRYAMLTSTEYYDMKAIVTSHLGITISDVNGIGPFVTYLAADGAVMAASETVGEISRWTIPQIETYIMAPTASYSLLERCTC